MHSGLDFLTCSFLRTDGLYRASVQKDGTVENDKADLYDQAFVLFAFAAAARAQPDNPAFPDRAASLLAHLDLLYTHPLGGFLETDDRVGLRSNPQMHLLEALLEWTELAPASAIGQLCASHARRIVALALDRLIDDRTGAIGEFFDNQWRFSAGLEGALREPGHQFEWAYLLDRANQLLDIDSAIAVGRLYGFGIRYGLDEGRVIFSVDGSGATVDGGSRLWAQTELLRTAIILSRTAPENTAAQCRAQAIKSGEWLRRFLDVPLAGSWRDRVTPEGEFIAGEPAPASSFYHIVTAFAALLDSKGGDDD
jgi:mannose-6-phosphate isomerase